MKTETIRKLGSYAHIMTYVRNELLQTDIFKASFDEKGFIYDVVKEFAERPVFFFEMSNLEVENAHFYTWMGGIQKRRYDNPYQNDLYYLHEIVHAAKMPYIAGMTFDNFKMKMFENELLASVYSEMLVYFALPELRQNTFTHPIYVDQFLRDPHYTSRYKDFPNRVMNELCIQRRNVMLSDKTSNMAEVWTHRFALQNDAWAEIWKDDYDRVERALIDLEKNALNFSGDIALNSHINWLLSEEVTGGTDIPFPRQAHAFAKVYWKNKEQYSLAINMFQTGQDISDVGKSDDQNLSFASSQKADV